MSFLRVVKIQPPPIFQARKVKVFHFSSYLLPFCFLLILLLLASCNSKTSSAANQQVEILNNIAFSIRSSGKFIKVPHSPRYLPEVGEDYALLIFFKMNRLPSKGDRVLLLSKFDSFSPAKRGLAISLKKDQDESVHPEVYWRSNAGVGGWYKFSDLPIVAKEWICLLLSFRVGALLGMHSVSFLPARKPEASLLGGYQLLIPDKNEPILPISKSDLLIGSFGGGEFRGAIGPIGIIKKDNLTEILPELLRYLKQGDLQNPPEIIDPSHLQLWIINKQDRSPHQGEVLFN
ncbi:MAG TPA: hypothetical protein PKD37_01945 [Oligoflexia bacterium]|nr:hypothetical protein [Oligoflexia bacterium]